MAADADRLRRLCLQAVQRAGLTPVGDVFHVFGPPGGITGVVLLAESHLALHTWPERGEVTLDLYVCNRSRDHGAAAAQVVDEIVAAFGPARVSRRCWTRGNEPSAER